MQLPNFMVKKVNHCLKVDDLKITTDADKITKFKSIFRQLFFAQKSDAPSSDEYLKREIV